MSGRLRGGIAGPVLWLLVAIALFSPVSGRAAEEAVLRVGVLSFGTASWQLDTMAANGLDRRHGFALQVTPYAGNEATKIALQGGAVDMIVTDWLWVSRQRAEGADFTFLPFSRATGALLVPAGSPIEDVADLAGRRIGVAGGPLDKSWLLLRALARQQAGLDLASAATPVFGAPPLLNEEFRAGRLDAVLTYWQYAARLTVLGGRTILGVADMVQQLGMDPDTPLLGFAFRADWAAAHPALIEGFAAAAHDAAALLAQSDDEWRRLAPLTGAADEVMVEALRDGYRAGIPAGWGPQQEAGAARLFAIMARLGGRDLVGDSDTLQPGTFWSGADR